jgi:peptide-methionine (R)-S-oxide reductase
MTDSKDTSDSEWREKLTPEQFHVLREAGTERAFTGQYDKHFADGSYRCAGCGELLFESDSKYNSGCGWPAFTRPAQADGIEERRDISHGMIRTEVLCNKCGGHLGHVFPDGPAEEGGMRYCINSLSLDFEEKE